MKRNVVVSLLLSIALIFGGGLLNVAIAEDSGDTVIITPFSSDQPITENDVLGLDEATVQDNSESASAAWQPDDSVDVRKKPKKGTVIVNNTNSSHAAQVQLDGKSYGSCLYGGHTLKILKVPQGPHTLYAYECPVNNGHWGPHSFTLNKTYTWTLY